MSRAWPCVRIAIGGGAVTETVARMRTRGSPSKRMDTIVRVRPTHIRCVITVVRDGNAVAEAAFQGAKSAVARIDMNHHRGEHPRVGALDVLPFVPISGVTMDDCVALAKSVGKRIADELQVQ